MVKQKDRRILLYLRTVELPAQPQTADLRTFYSQEKPPSIEFTPLLLLISPTGSHMHFQMIPWTYTADDQRSSVLHRRNPSSNLPLFKVES